MENEKRPINLNVGGDLPENVTIEIIEREGDAPMVNDDISYNFTGVISSVRHYLKFKDSHETGLSVVFYSYNQKKIHLTEYSNKVLHNDIEGQLIENPELNDFGINKDVFFTSKELISLVRKRGYMFGKNQAEKLIEQLRNFEVKFEQTLEEKDDGKGNKKNAYNQAIKWTKGEVFAKNDFIIEAPLYKGMPEVKTIMEIEVDRNSANQPVFAFYSLDFDAVMRTTAIDTINKEINDISELGYLCLQKD